MMGRDYWRPGRAAAAQVKIDLTEVAGTAGARGSHEFSTPVPGDDQVEVLGLVRGALTVTNMGRLLVLQGTFRGQVKMQCGRCLEPMTAAVEGALDEEFASQTAGVEPPADTIEKQEPHEAAYSAGILDVTELVRQQLLLSVPLQPVCRPDCRGLCPTCGQNLNLGACLCPPAGPRGPLADLGRMIEEKRKSSR
jgi:uncharacterized protein